MQLFTNIVVKNTCLSQDDYDTIEYLNELREACLEAYTGIIQGLKGDGKEPSRK